MTVLKTKNPLVSKTVWLNVAVAVVGLIELYMDIIPDEYRGSLLALVGVANLALRSVTKTAVSFDAPVSKPVAVK